VVKRKPEAKDETPQKFAVGESVIILRPNKLWFDCVGEVVSFNNGLHRVKIKAKADGSTFSHFHADVPGEQLDSFI